MPENRYTPPGADLSQTPVPPRAPWPAWRAVLVGMVVDLGGTTLAGLLIGVVWYIALTRAGVSAEQIHAEMGATDHWSAFSIVSALVGSVFSYLGGFVGTRLARRADLRLGFVQAGLSIALGLGMSSDAQQPAMLASLVLLTAASVIAGAYAGRVVPKA